MQPARGEWRTAGRPPRRGAARARGVTLVEMLVVISIMGLLLAVGVGVWISFRSGSRRKSAYLALVGACRRARVFSVEESAPSRLVLLPPVNGRHGFRAEGQRLVGFWHLESGHDPGKPGAADPLVGFAGRTLHEAGGEFYVKGQPVNGYRGTGLYFGKGGSVVLPEDSGRLPRGGSFSLWWLPEHMEFKQRLLSRGKELVLAMAPGGGLEAKVGTTTLTTEGYRLPRGRWSHVAFFFSAEEVVISVNDVVRARTAHGEEIELPAEKERGLPLEMGAGEWLLFGTVDEIAVHRSVREQEIRLAPGFKLECAGDQIRFDAAGALDRNYHAGPVRVGVTSPEEGGRTETRWMTVTLMGEIREE